MIWATRTWLVALDQKFDVVSESHQYFILFFIFSKDMTQNARRYIYVLDSIFSAIDQRFTNRCRSNWKTCTINLWLWWWMCSHWKILCRFSGKRFFPMKMPDLTTSLEIILVICPTEEWNYSAMHKKRYKLYIEDFYDQKLLKKLFSMKNPKSWKKWSIAPILRHFYLFVKILS